MKKIILLSLAICVAIGAGFFSSSVVEAQIVTVFNTNLSVGSRGPAVTDMQNFLVSKGLLNSGNATGYFGNLTKAALKAYQRQNNISATGYFGPLTRSRMNGDSPVAIGGDRDLHGCTIAGGYMWDAELNKCARPWEKLSALFAGNTWYMVDTSNAISSGVYFKIGGDAISGRACNSFSGKVVVSNTASTITVSNTISTLMACMDNGLSKAETDLFGLLNGTVRVQLEDSTGYIVLSKEGKTIRFSKTPIGGTPASNGDTDIHGCNLMSQHWDSSSSACVRNNQVTGSASARCVAQGGSWSAEYNECAGVSSASCAVAGGTFNECASPCRHNPSAQVCIAMCAQTCVISK